MHLGQLEVSGVRACVGCGSLNSHLCISSMCFRLCSAQSYSRASFFSTCSCATHCHCRTQLCSVHQALSNEICCLSQERTGMRCMFGSQVREGIAQEGLTLLQASGVQGHHEGGAVLASELN